MQWMRQYGWSAGTLEYLPHFLLKQGHTCSLRAAWVILFPPCASKSFRHNPWFLPLRPWRVQPFGPLCFFFNPFFGFPPEIPTLPGSWNQTFSTPSPLSHMSVRLVQSLGLDNIIVLGGSAIKLGLAQSMFLLLTKRFMVCSCVFCWLCSGPSAFFWGHSWLTNSQQPGSRQQLPSSMLQRSRWVCVYRSCAVRLLTHVNKTP